MRDLLLVMACRRIPVCLRAIEQLPIDRLWIRNLSEAQIARNWGHVIELADGYDRLIMVGDDSCPRPHALDAVRRYGRHYDVVTGYSNLSADDWRVNLARQPLRGDHPTPESYDLYTMQDMQECTQPVVRTWLTGLTLASMSHDMWQDFPFDVFAANGAGYGSDFHLSKRLESAGVPIWGVRDAFVWHHKRVWNEVQQDTDERVLVGVEQAELVLETSEGERVDRWSAVVV